MRTWLPDFKKIPIDEAIRQGLNHLVWPMVISGIGTLFVRYGPSAPAGLSSLDWFAVFLAGVLILSAAYALMEWGRRQRHSVAAPPDVANNPVPQSATQNLSRFTIDGAPLRLREGEHFSKQTVVLDGFHYKKCTFHDVLFQFNGGSFLMEDIEINPPVRFGSESEPVKKFVTFVSNILRPMAAKAKPEPDAWFQEAVFYCVHKRWLGASERALSKEGQLSEAADYVTEFRQRARNGNVVVWGKHWENSTWDPIPADYWAHHWVEPTEIMRERPEHIRTSSATPQGKDGPFYKSLKVSRSQIEDRWPPQQENA